ncbi:Asp23/Gls24 family envelope stress response protein [Eubacterium coprostanoligenes]|uniref:Asp23/Gls24 family envelope stress response protein n=1 Tax=Eubacterium coprostanoligenes TaxID=290054 RepID=UPI0023557A89|nr:Asp23/Gls24 family envelope stress response protein [Eubacterium coprostanoligenes]MCI6353616.1 Asp23/Gls24 family envelope stress response protein [Eubacterium coprostanoligenes]MCI6360718.1 Asp23/Gls24 family envelope stress response protein [Eubacterium coprostanoligenes]MDD6665480.1 Asp23/Gls24 family envelope stress response protein [Eubacterium coprostanoligenes]MDD7358474.1 Asp23/Gls24 family envelope stress response protein [Eubacterium coprostanoligenes]MDY4699344.1 Asp23/Gls24 fam
MIKYENPNGYIEITNNYFSRLVGNAAQSCFGVTRMVNANPVQTIRSAIKSRVDGVDLDTSNQGVTIKSVNGALVVDLSIAVSYGVNINAIADSIVNKVRYTIESTTDLKVSEVNVHVEGIDSIN